MTDVARAKEIIGSPALLELKLVEAGPSSAKEDLLKAYERHRCPATLEVISGAAERGAPMPGPSTTWCKKVAAVNGQDLADRPRGPRTRTTSPAVHFSLKPEGARKFGKVTGENVGRNLAIILDNRVQSAPRIDGRITDEGQISGGFTVQEAPTSR